MQGSWRGELVPSAEDPYRDAGAVARTLVILLTLSAIVDTVAVASDISYLQFLDRAAAGLVTTSEAEAIDSRSLLIGSIQFLVFVATGIAFVVWVRRMYRNLRGIGVAGVRFKPGWAVGAWFVPLLNAIRPKEIVNDIWRASDPEVPPTQEGPGLGRPVSPLIDLWWMVFLFASASGRTSLRESVSAETLEELRSSTLITLAADGLAALSALMAILVVRATTRRQQDRATALQGQVIPQTPPAPQPSTG